MHGQNARQDSNAISIKLGAAKQTDGGMNAGGMKTSHLGLKQLHSGRDGQATSDRLHLFLHGDLDF